MAYSTSNPPRLETQPIAGVRIWQYVSTDAIATVRAAGYITNAKDLGMKVQDLVRVIDTNTPTHTLCVVLSVNATTGVADLSDGTAVAQTNS